MELPSPPCIEAVVVAGRRPVKTGDPGFLRGKPTPCRIVEGFTLVIEEEREELELHKEDDMCIVTKPVKSVLPVEACDFLEKIKEGKPESKVLLGPGGTGKTLTLELIRRTAPFNIIDFEPEAIMSKFVGETEKRLREILSECEASEPCLILVDEGDLLIKSRSMTGDQSGQEAMRQNLVRILLRTLQRWYNEKRRLGMVVASNYPASMLEKPLLRAGRLGEPIYYPIPDKKQILKLAELYGKKIDDNVVDEILRLGLPHSNVVEYLRTGRLQKWQPEAWAGIEYAKSAGKRVLRLAEKARIVVAEHWEVGVKLAGIITASEYGKPLLYLKDPKHLQDLDWLGRSMKLPIAIPFTEATARANIVFYDYPYGVFFIGKEWNLPFYRITRDDIMRIYGRATVAEAFCGEKRHIDAGRMIMCLSGVERR